MTKREVTNLLRAILKALDGLDEAEFDQVLDGKGRLKFIGLEQRHSAKRKEGKVLPTKLAPEELQMLGHQLQGCKSREEAVALLHRDGQTLLKESLSQLARLLGIRVDKSDRRDAIERKIVEFIVGSRLRSEAIKSLNLKAP